MTDAVTSLWHGYQKLTYQYKIGITIFSYQLDLSFFSKIYGDVDYFWEGRLAMTDV